jgi:hypothetical protein
MSVAKIEVACIVRDLLSWLVSGGSSKQNSRDHIINLRMVSRRLTRSQKKLEVKEREMERKVRVAIEKGDMQAARLYANDIVRSRNWARGYQSLNSKIEGLIFKLERTDAVQSLAGEMKSVAVNLKAASESLNMADLDDVIMDLEKSMEDIEVTSEVMEESVGSLFEGDIDNTEVDNVLAEYGAEVGVTASTGLPTPTTSTPQKEKTNISDLEKEIQDLRKQD